MAPLMIYCILCERFNQAEMYHSAVINMSAYFQVNILWLSLAQKPILISKV